MKNNMAMRRQTYGRACKCKYRINQRRRRRSRRKNGGKKFRLLLSPALERYRLLGLLEPLQYLERLNKSPQEYTDGIALSQKFDEPGRTKQPQKSDIDEVLLEKKKGRRKGKYSRNCFSLSFFGRSAIWFSFIPSTSYE